LIGIDTFLFYVQTLVRSFFLAFEDVPSWSHSRWEHPGELKGFPNPQRKGVNKGMTDKPKRNPEGKEPKAEDTEEQTLPQPEEGETEETPTSPKPENEGETIEDLRQKLDEANKARGKAVFELGQRNKQIQAVEERLGGIEEKLKTAKGTEEVKYLKEQIEIITSELETLRSEGQKKLFEEGKLKVIEEVLSDVPEAKDFILSMLPDFEYTAVPKGIEKWDNATEALDYVRWKLSEAKRRYLARRKKGKEETPPEPGTQPVNPPVSKTKTPNLDEEIEKAKAAGDIRTAIQLKKQKQWEESQF